MMPPSAAEAQATSPPSRTHQRTLTGRITKSPLPPSPSTPKTPVKKKKTSPATPSSASSKYGPCPSCHTGRRVRSRYNPHVTSPVAGRWRFVCSNRASAASNKKKNGGGGCPYYEVLDADPLYDPAFIPLPKTPSKTPQGRKDRGPCPACGEGNLVEKCRDTFRWREKVRVCEGKKGGRGRGGCGYGQEVGAGGDDQEKGGEGVKESKREKEKDGFWVEAARVVAAGATAGPAGRRREVIDLTVDEAEAPRASRAALARLGERRPTKPTTPRKSVVVIGDEEPRVEDSGTGYSGERGAGKKGAGKKGAGKGNFIELDSDEETEFIRLADHVPDELDEEDELRLIEFADKLIVEKEARRASSPAWVPEPGNGTGDKDSGSQDFDEFGSEDESQLVKLADRVVDEFDEQDELKLIELADAVSASLSPQGRPLGVL
ncbi:hypothetical protein VTK56DRAFT_9488 [Thermocarpiscus australiensis]